VRIHSHQFLSVHCIHRILMVWSVIDNTYQYPEHADLSPQDIGTDLCIFTVDMYDTEVDIMVGLCDTETVPGINTYSIYAMRDKQYVRIGLFEISAAQSRTCLDDVGDVDVSRLGNPLLFRNAKRVIRDARPIRSASVWRGKVMGGGSTHEDPTYKGPTYSPSPFQINTGRFTTKLKAIPIQSSKLCQREKWHTNANNATKSRDKSSQRKTIKKPKRGSGSDWLGYVLKSTKIHTVSVNDSVNASTNTSRGSSADTLDCVLIALNSISQQPMDHDKTRISLGEYIGANDAQPTVSMCESYRDLTGEMKRHMDKLSDDNDTLRGTSTGDMNEAKKLIDKGSDNKVSFGRLRRGVDLLDRFAVRTGIWDFNQCDNSDDLVGDISSHVVPVNIPFLSMMENHFQIRILCFVCDSSTEVGYWVHMSPEPLGGASHPTTPTPTPIVCVAMDDSTCQLVKYKGNTVFTQETLPWTIRCIAAANAPVVDMDTTAHSLAPFNTSSTRYVCSTAVGNEIPGFGVGEYVDAETYLDATNDSVRENILHVSEGTAVPKLVSYISLYGEVGWRTMLSDEWMCDITHDKHTWGSVAHYLAAIPYKAYPEYYTVFSKKLNNPSDVSMDPRLISKHVKSIPKSITRGKEATDKERFSIYEAKFSDPTLATVLKKTGDSVLMRFGDITCCDSPRTLVPNIELMRVREK